MTSAMQMVADLETPTRQWTKVAVPSDLPFSVLGVSFVVKLLVLRCCGQPHTDKVQTSVKLVREWINPVILHAIDIKHVLPAPATQVSFGPANGLTDAQNASDAHGLQQFRIVGVAQISEVHVWKYATWQAPVDAREPGRRVSLNL